MNLGAAQPRYLEKSLGDVPDHGNSFLTSLLDDLGTMKPVAWSAGKVKNRVPKNAGNT
jgi:hypothetical protein